MSETFLSGAEFDQPPYDGKPRTVYMICSTGRSGSTLLCSLLTNTGLMGVPHEYLNISRHGQFLIARFLAEPAASVSMGEYFDAVVKHRTTPNGVFGIKAHSNQWLPYFKNGFLSGYFGDVKHVLIRRRDILGQAISLVIASQTGKWTSHETQTAQPVYDRVEIQKAIKVTEHYNEIWDKFFAHAKIVPCTVYYEDLLEKPTEEIQRVLDFVGVRDKVSIDLEQAGLKREATALNQEWKDRFAQETA